MITSSNERPLSLQPLNDGNYHFNYNIEETEVQAQGENQQPRQGWICETAFIAGEPTVSKIVAAVVRENYTDDEVAMMGALHNAAQMGMGEEPEGYADYLDLVVTVSSLAQAAIAELNSELEED